MPAQLELWVQSLLLGANNLEGLSMCMTHIPCPPVMSRLKALRHLELSGGGGKPWLKIFFVDLAYCLTLETLVIGDSIDEALAVGVAFTYLPDMSLHDLPYLRHVELYGWIPGRTFSLPPGCQLQLSAIVEDHWRWEQKWESIRNSATVLCLGYHPPESWPQGIQEFSCLEFLAISCKALQLADVGILQRIPYINLHFEQETTLVLSAGSWQSLEIHGQKGFDIEFRDVDAFVQGTNHFLFKRGSVGMYSLVMEACKRQKVPCHRRQCCEFWEFSGNGIDCLSTTANVFWKEHDAGPKQGLAPLCGVLVSQEDFWPKENLYWQVFGE